MPRTQIIELPLEDYFDSKLRDEIGPINGHILALRRARAEFDRTAADVTEADLDTLDVNDGLIAARGWAGRFELLQQELLIRKAIATTEEKIHGAIAAAWDLAIEQHQQAQARIRKSLVSFGYTEPAEGVPDPTAYQPNFVMRHPDVFRARQKVETLEGKFRDRARAQQNNAAIAEVRSQMDALRRKHMATA